MDDDEDAKRLLAFNDQKLARFLFGTNSQTGTGLALVWIAVFALVVVGSLQLLD